MTRQLSPEGALIHPNCSITECDFGAYTEVGAGAIEHHNGRLQLLLARV